MNDLSALETLDGYRRWFTDVEFWQPYINKVCFRHALKPSAPLRIGVPGTYPTFIVAERWVIKFFGRLFAGAASYAAEKEAGRLVACGRGIPAPPIIAAGELNRAGWPWPYLIYPFISGASLGEQAGLLDPAGWVGLAGQLGAMVRRLHALPLAGSAVFPDHYEEYRAFLTKQRAVCLQNHRQWRRLPGRLIEQIDAFLAPVDDLIDMPRAAHLIHADFTRDHLLGEVRNGQWNTRALIDFGDAMTGDLLYELTALHLDIFRADRRLLAAFLDAYGFSGYNRADFPRRAMSTALLHQWDVFGNLPEDMLRLSSLDDLANAIWQI